MRLTLIGFVSLAGGLALFSSTRAADIVPGSATYEYSNVFTTRLFATPDTPQIDLLVESTGVFVTEWEMQERDMIAFEIVSAVAEGEVELPGIGPVPFQILAGRNEVPELVPFFGPFEGAYTNVVQDEMDPGFQSGDPSSLESADVQINGPFKQILADGTTFYSEAYSFEGAIDSLPYSVGTEFVGTKNSLVRLQLGPEPDPDIDPIVGETLSGGIVRIESVIPEPSTLALTLFCTVALIRRPDVVAC